MIVPVKNLLIPGLRRAALARVLSIAALGLSAAPAAPSDAPRGAGVAALLRQVEEHRAASDAAKSPKEKLAWARRSYESAQQARDAAPSHARARLAVATAAGRLAELESPRRRMELSRVVRDEAEAAVKLDPRLADAWHVIGRWNYEVANLPLVMRVLAEAVYGRFPDASNTRAAEALEQAVRHEPGRLMHHAELGRAYAALGRKDEARRELELALTLPVRSKDEEESRRRAVRALNNLK